MRLFKCIQQKQHKQNQLFQLAKGDFIQNDFQFSINIGFIS